MQVECKKCQRKFMAQPHLFGKRVPCPQCGNAIGIPAPAPTPAPSPQPPESLVVACGCGRRFRASAKLLGKQIVCPGCRQLIDVRDRPAPPQPTAFDFDALSSGIDDFSAAGPMPWQLGPRPHSTATFQFPFSLSRKTQRTIFISLAVCFAILSSVFLVITVGSVAFKKLAQIGKATRNKGAIGSQPKFWNVTPDSVSLPPVQASKAGTLISWPKNHSVWFDPQNRRTFLKTEWPRFLAADRFTLFDACSGRAIHNFEQPLRWDKLLHISDDRRYLVGLRFAETPTGKKKYQPATVEVVHAANGKRVMSVLAQSAFGASARFISGDRLVVVSCEDIVLEPQPGLKKTGPFGAAHVAIYQVTTGQIERKFVGDPAMSQTAAFSAGGKYLALSSERFLYVYELATGTLVGKAPVPKLEIVPGFQTECRAVRFSNNGKRLAALYLEITARDRLVTWDATTGIKLSDHYIDDHDFTSYSKGSGDCPLAWSDDDSACICYGTKLINPSNGSDIWRVESGNSTFSENIIHFTDDSGVLVRRGEKNEPGSLERIAIPSAQIRWASQVMNSTTPVFLKPDQSLSLQVTVGDVRHTDRETVERALTSTITGKLKQIGIGVKKDQNVSLNISYSEKEGELLSESAPGAIIQWHRTPTGRTAASTIAILTFEWHAKGVKKPLHQKAMMFSPSLVLMKGEFSEVNARHAVFENLLQNLSKHQFPYFISQSSPMIILPGQTKVDAN